MTIASAASFRSRVPGRTGARLSENRGIRIGDVPRENSKSTTKQWAHLMLRRLAELSARTPARQLEYLAWSVAVVGPWARCQARHNRPSATSMSGPEGDVSAIPLHDKVASQCTE